VSVAGPDQVYVARPQTCAELRHMAALGVQLIDPAGGTGANWASMNWEQAASLRVDLVLADGRVTGIQPRELETSPAWRTLTAGTGAAAWNPEIPCSHAAHASVFRAVAVQATG
jgi:iron complex transport system substrate-binding protein